jgi:cytochrome c peroxidase
MTGTLRALAAAATLAAASPGTAHDARAIDQADLAYTYVVGACRPEYTPPAPGSYRLPTIDTVDDHPLLASDGTATTLFALKRDRLAVVAFVYSSCLEATGCPISMAVFGRIDHLLAADPQLAKHVTLVTVSFDPERDDPARMATLRALHAPRSDWRFATTRGEAELAPLLDDFGQPVARLNYEDGRWTGLFRHVLKVFLLDAGNRVRNVYSVGMLNPDLVLNDLRTVLAQPAG